MNRTGCLREALMHAGGLLSHTLTHLADFECRFNCLRKAQNSCSVSCSDLADGVPEHDVWHRSPEPPAVSIQDVDDSCDHRGEGCRVDAEVCVFQTTSFKGLYDYNVIYSCKTRQLQRASRVNRVCEAAWGVLPVSRSARNPSRPLTLGTTHLTASSTAPHDGEHFRRAMSVSAECAPSPGKRKSVGDAISLLS